MLLRQYVFNVRVRLEVSDSIPYQFFVFKGYLRAAILLKISDSGMPEQTYWESLFDGDGIVRSFGWEDGQRKKESRVIEFGCGYGTFTNRLAKLFSGRIDAFEIDPIMIEMTRNRIGSLPKVHLHQLDFLDEEWPEESKSADVAVMFHMLHLSEPFELLKRVANHLASGATIAILHWRSDKLTPRGPAMQTRPTRSDIEDWAARLKVKKIKQVDLDHSPHHAAWSLELP